MPRSWTNEQLVLAVKNSISYAEVARTLNLVPAGGTYKTLKSYVVELQLSVTHFKGQGWNTGERYKAPRKAIPLNEILVVNSTFTSSYHLKLRLLKEGVFKAECLACGKSQVLNPFTGKLTEIPLELDHINGIPTDNRLENLRLLDPICHSFTDTYRGKNKR